MCVEPLIIKHIEKYFQFGQKETTFLILSATYCPMISAITEPQTESCERGTFMWGEHLQGTLKLWTTYTPLHYHSRLPLAARDAS